MELQILAILEYMFYNSCMNALDTLVELSGQMELEHAEESRAERRPSAAKSADEAQFQREPIKPACFTPKGRPEFTEREKRAVFVHPAQLPNGKPILLLKTLLSSACERDCYYCPFRAGRDFRRATFKPQEFAELFMKFNQAKMAEGIFLSSGIAAGGAQYTKQDSRYRGNPPQANWVFAAICISRSCRAQRRARSNAPCSLPTASRSISKRQTRNAWPKLGAA